MTDIQTGHDRQSSEVPVDSTHRNTAHSDAPHDALSNNNHPQGEPPHAEVLGRSGVSAIWVIPFIALMIGAWMLVNDYLNQGPSFEIRFDNADDLVEGKTKIKLLSVDVGLVNTIELNEDVSGIVVSASLEKKYEELLKSDTRFWVERARIGTDGVTGLNTLLKGSYIKLQPGSSDKSKNIFEGLNDPPLTDANAPGVRLVLESASASAANTGDSVLFNGFGVGGVESKKLDPDSQIVKYDVFIRAPYHLLVTSNVRFWDISGVSVSTSARGFNVDMGSLDTLLKGGLAFSLPPGFDRGEPVTNGHSFKLFKTYDQTLGRHFKEKQYYVISFEESISGLSDGAPVVYRGITIGQVERVLLKEMITKGQSSADGTPIPVLIYIEPGRLELGDNKQALETLQDIIETGVSNGLRASLQTGNLLSGSQLVSLDYFDSAPKSSMGEFNRYKQLPTISAGITQLQQQVSQVLSKFEKLPLEKTLNNANNAISQLDQSMRAIDYLLQSEKVQGLPYKVDQSLQDFDIMLESFRQLSERLQHSADVLPVKDNEDIQPRAKVNDKP